MVVTDCIFFMLCIRTILKLPCIVNSTTMDDLLFNLDAFLLRLPSLELLVHPKATQNLSQSNCFARLGTLLLVNINFTETFACPICGPYNNYHCDGTLLGFQKDLMDTLDSDIPPPANESAYFPNLPKVRGIPANLADQ